MLLVIAGCAAQTQSSPELIATLERLEAAATKSELAAEQAAAAAERAATDSGENESRAPEGPYHTALRRREQRNATPQPVASERDASRIAGQFLQAQNVDWGQPSRVGRTPDGWYLVEFDYRQTDRWDLDGVLAVDPQTGDILLPIAR